MFMWESSPVHENQMHSDSYTCSKAGGTAPNRHSSVGYHLAKFYIP
jgi:hypothetical protein